MNPLEVAYASASVDSVPIQSLEIIDLIAKEQGLTDSVIRICDGFHSDEKDGEEGMYLGLEDNSQAFFISSGMGISLPPKSVKGTQNLTFQIDNVTGEARKFIDRAIKNGSKVILIYRVHLSSYLDSPATAPLEMTVVAGKSNIQTTAATASFNNLVNRAWPRRRYTSKITPGLKYAGT